MEVDGVSAASSLRSKKLRTVEAIAVKFEAITSSKKLLETRMLKLRLRGSAIALIHLFPVRPVEARMQTEQGTLTESYVTSTS